jgi:hypothetical protein
MGNSENKSPKLETLVLAAIAVLAAMFIIFQVANPKNWGGSHTSPANACINNMRQIDAAINQWALENTKTNGTVVTENDIKPYIKLNSKSNVPGCPSGGKYIYGKVGDIPQITCSLSTATPAHKLP